MKKIGNIDALAEQFILEDEAGLITKLLGKSAGSEKLYVNLDSVPFKAYSTKYHSHSTQEEFFLILSGKGILRLNNEEIEVSKGDFLAKPAGKDICHTFYNPYKASLLILDIGTIEPEDTCYYPDEDIYMQKTMGVHHVWRKADELEGWSSEPNNEAENKQATDSTGNIHFDKGGTTPTDGTQADDTQMNHYEPGQLLKAIDKLSTTKLGAERIRNNLSLDIEDVLAWCKAKISEPESVIYIRGKNYYVEAGDCIITINRRSYTIITAHTVKPD